nr:type II toxin-antitoxin system RelE/ParE family toxin [Gammaproteobacteria bacterium]
MGQRNAPSGPDTKVRLTYEALAGDRKSQYSIRTNARWRICFCWLAGEDGPQDVEIVDYH